MAEITAAIISVGGSAIMGMSGYLYRKYFHKFEKRKLKKQLKQYKDHELFHISVQGKIICDYDSIRSSFFQDVHDELLYKNTQNVFKTLFEKFKHIGKEIDSYNNTEMYNILKEFKEIMISSQEDYISNLPIKIQDILYRMLHTYRDGINKAIDVVHTETDNHSIIFQLLNVCTVILHLVSSEWKITANQINGQLSGQIWKGSRIGYSYTGPEDSFYKMYENIINFLEQVNENTVSCLTDENFTLMVTSNQFNKLTEYSKNELINKNCNILQNDISYELNYQANKKFVENIKNNENAMEVFHQNTKSGNSFLFLTYVSSIRIIDIDVKLCHISVQHYSSIINISDDDKYRHNKNLHTKMGCLISALLSPFDFISISNNTEKYKLKYLLIGKHNWYNLQVNDILTDKLKITKRDIDHLYERCDIIEKDFLKTASVLYNQNGYIITAEAWYLYDHLIIIHRHKT